MRKGWHEDIAERLAAMKKDLARAHGAGGRQAEAIPAGGSRFPIPDGDLEGLHSFMEGSRMYGPAARAELGGVRCMVYEGDIDRYWLSSIGHDSCRAQFSPTWMASAYVVATLAYGLGCREAVDVGAGDGRIAFCAGLLGMESHAVEVDPMLAGLQESNGAANFASHRSDAVGFDYSSLDLGHPAFFIGGLAQMGGDALASGVMKGVRRIPGLWENSAWILAGTHAPKYAPDPGGCAGWGTVLRENGLVPEGTVILPTAWTLGEPQDTPYVLARPDRNPH